MASPSTKRKISDVVSGEQTTSRSGRVRKPKVFYDPSDMEAKRRSLPNMETPKPKKTVKLVESEPIIDSAASIEMKKPDNTMAPEKVKRDPSENAAATINNRRKTFCTLPVFDDDNGCIVCGRSDIKKGRFVNCIDCIKRGHFTCLRNDKLFKTADQEHNWQCPTCKICEYCNKINPNELLYKCIICLNSYHLHCSSKISPLPKSVVKKKFTCGNCTKGTSLVKPVEVSKSLIVNRKSDGFPGFSHENSTKVEQKSTIELKVKKVVSFPKDRSSTSSKSSASDRKDENGVAFELDIKVEKKSPTPQPEPEQEPEPEPGLAQVEAYEQQIKANIKTMKTITVRTDLVQPTKIKTDEVRPESDDDRMDIEYDTKTAITPHESIPDVRKWDCDEVYTYFMGRTTPEFAQLLKDNQIDGDALLLIKREDVLNRFNLKLGPALRLYSHIISLQYKNNNPILAWNVF